MEWVQSLVFARDRTHSTTPSLAISKWRVCLAHCDRHRDHTKPFSLLDWKSCVLISSQSSAHCEISGLICSLMLLTIPLVGRLTRRSSASMDVGDDSATVEYSISKNSKYDPKTKARPSNDQRGAVYGGLIVFLFLGAFLSTIASLQAIASGYIAVDTAPSTPYMPMSEKVKSSNEYFKNHAYGTPLQYEELARAEQTLPLLPKYPDKPSSSSSSNGLTTQTVQKQDPTPSSNVLTIEVWEKYTLEHSIENLDSASKFAVVPYWCPERAGNILHNLINNVAWSVLHDRTIVFEYTTKNTPQKEANSQDLCEAILPRSDKFLSWSQAKERYNLPEPVSFSIGIEKDQQDAQVVYFPQIPDMGIDAEKATWSDHPMSARYKTYVSAHLSRISSEFYSLGPEFTHGMLLREIFDWGVIEKQLPVFSKTGNLTGAPISIALHSRHIVDADTGEWINRETSCLSNILAWKQPAGRNCVVYLMSDRPLSLELLTTWLKERGCEAVTVDHQSQDTDTAVLEHGPNSGIGFFQDLQFASRARGGLVGNRARSSYMLLEELVTYDTVMEYLNYHANPPVEELLSLVNDLEFCALPRTAPWGYNYGDGTPTFVRPAYLKPLEPDSMVLEYLKTHDSSVWEQDTDLNSRKFALVEYNCDDEAPGEWGHTITNAWLLSIVTNRTLLFRYTGTNEDCQRVAFREPWVKNYDLVKEQIHDPPVVLTLENSLGQDRTASWETQTWNGAEPIESQTVIFPSLTMQVFENQQVMLAAEDPAIVQSLYRLGTDYMYGMLWSRLFRFGREVLQDLPQSQFNDAIVLVSNVTYGSGLGGVRRCLTRFANRKDAVPCELIPVTSSRDSARQLEERLSVELTNCSILASEPGRNDSLLLWFRQVALATKAAGLVVEAVDQDDVDAILVRELVEYHRIRNIWLAGQVPPVLKPLERCSGDDTTEK